MQSEFQLAVRRGGTTETHHFDQDTVVIGRSRECDLTIDDRLVSRRHCRIERIRGGHVLVDEGSQNRVKLRGQPIDRCELRDGDTFTVGGTELTFRSIENANSSDETSLLETGHHPEDLETFVQLARALNEEQDLSRLLTSVVDAAIQLSGAERGFLIIGSGDDAAVEVARDFAREEVPSPELKISHTIAQRVRASGVAELATDAQDDDRFQGLHSVEDLKLRSVLCLPLRIRGEIEGVLYVDNRLQQQVFHDHELSLLTSLADHAAIAIHNARTMAELRAKQAEAQAAYDRVAQLNAALRGQVAAQRAELSEVRAELGVGRGQFRHDYQAIVGDGRRMREVFALLDRYIDADDAVLILGESGTGKELVAHAIHLYGKRSAGPFITENVAALPESLLESELFGHRKGAFTGATADKAGLLEAASGGVLFLDEIGDMPLDLQAKLLRVIQEGEVRPIGAREAIKVDVRLITATNRNLEEMVRDGDFREDLYYRLNVLSLCLPPLRQRLEDVSALVRRLLLDVSDGGGRVRVDPAAMEALTTYHWPGNVRELQNEIRRAAILSDGVILREHLSEAVRNPARGDESGGPVPSEAGTTLPDMVQSLEMREITGAFHKAGGNKSRAAEMLGLSRFALQRKLEKYHIGEDPPSDSGEGDETA